MSSSSRSFRNTAEDYATVMDVNMAGFFYITQLAVAEMEKAFKRPCG